ncbi:MAG: caspase family protein [Acidobacteriota bacterium]|nr:caspase family protein [Acidobacteriota bacterium]MDH3523833.1 caspase family protein [Acidobacteriota bacterium]
MTCCGNGNRKALCVGIDDYPTSPLGGCVNDAELWAQTLEGIGFAEPVLLTDADATREGILTALGDLVDGAAPGDVLVFQYSGHGTQLPDLDGDEDDSNDESLCPVDFDEGAFVIDDDLWALLGRLGEGVSLTVFLDCCHSGSATRVAAGRAARPRASTAKARFLRATPKMKKAHAKFRAELGPVEHPVELMTWVNFSACQPHEVAWEHAGQGDFTRHATTALLGGLAGRTNEAFHQEVVSAFGPTPQQRPYLDCPAEALGRGLLEPITAGPRTPASRSSGDVAALLESVARLLRSGSSGG